MRDPEEEKERGMRSSRKRRRWRKRRNIDSAGRMHGGRGNMNRDRKETRAHKGAREGLGGGGE